MVLPNYVDPLRGFKFEVDVSDFPQGLGFQRVSGINGAIGIRDLSEITNTVTPLKLVQDANFEPVQLARGVDFGGYMLAWWQNVLTKMGFQNNIVQSAQREITSLRKTVDIYVLDKGSAERVFQFRLFKAFPQSYQFSELNADSSDVLVQSMSLANEGWYARPLKSSPNEVTGALFDLAGANFG